MNPYIFNPFHAQLSYRLGELCAENKDYREARQNYRQALALMNTARSESKTMDSELKSAIIKSLTSIATTYRQQGYPWDALDIELQIDKEKDAYRFSCEENVRGVEKIVAYLGGITEESRSQNSGKVVLQRDFLGNKADIYRELLENNFAAPINRMM